MARRYAVPIIASLALMVASFQSIAQTSSAKESNFPTRPVRMVIAFPPGGGTDILGRFIASKLAELWGQPVIVDNRIGASGIIGSEFVAKSPPDGYTILLATSGTHGVSQSLYRNLPYDAIKDFTPITRATISPNILVVSPAVSANSVAELIQLAKAKPSQLNFGSSGIGSNPHLAGELFKSMAGVDIVHIPYKGVGPAIVDLLSGQTQLMIAGAIAVLPHIKTGKLRALATTSERRYPELPVLSAVPTLAESGLPGYEADTWFGMFGPAGLPPSTLEALNTSINDVLRRPETISFLRDQGMIAAGGSPAQLSDVLKFEIAKWAKIVKESAIPISNY